MTLNDLYKELKQELKIPVAYDHFEESPSVPFIAYVDEGKSVFIADRNVYTKKTKIRIELYTEEKDIELEEKLEELFYKKNIIFDDDATVYISKEKLYVHYYHISI